MDARVLERLGLTLNEKKTSLRDARRERFDFLGYTFGRTSAGGLAGSTSVQSIEEERGQDEAERGGASDAWQ